MPDSIREEDKRPSTRQQIILATVFLLEKQGYPATGINQIVQVSRAPKGSLYYYFPDGKEQIVSEAVLYAGRELVERMRCELASNDLTLQSLHEYILRIADKVEEKNFTAGNPLTIVAVEAAGTSERISRSCLEIYDQMQAVLAEKFACCGLTELEAAEQACLTLAGLEGGIILSRVHRTAEPLRAFARHLVETLTLSGPPSTTKTEGHP